MQMLHSGGASGTGSFDQGYGQSRPAAAAPASAAPAPQQGGGAPAGPVDNGFDDGIPF